MPRVKRGVKGARRRKRILKQAKGYFSTRSKLMRTATEVVENAGVDAYRGRKEKKRTFRGLWQTRIAAVAKDQGTSYSKLMGLLKAKRVELNRKMLAELALNHPADFAAVVAHAKA